MKILCVLGKYQYGDPSRGISTEYAAFLPALKTLGHEVVHFESWNRRCHSDYAELNSALLRTVREYLPDVMLVVQMNYEIWTETLHRIRELGSVATICWTTDDSWKYREVSRFIGSAYHAMTTTYAEMIPEYHQDGIYNVLLTQWASNSEFLRQPLHAEDCHYPVSFVGAAHGNRKRRISELRKHGIPVKCFGYGWPDGPVSAEKLPHIMRESVISINFANSTKGRNQMKARTFEVPGAGGFLLTENAPDIGRFYTTGKEIEVFHSTKELLEKISYYLAHPRERDSVARAGFERTVHEHTYEIRMKEVLNFALNSRDIWLKHCRNPQSERSFDQVIQSHQPGFALKFLRKMLVLPCIPIWGNKRGPRAARRLVFELSWRFCKHKTFSASGWPGRMFPEQ
ncbi:glycosyltransferase [Desulfobacterales bacterium HSG2]|nr:glycosyltransferase [Desulfobacterales bacterium HSG2]